jgi:hypothetical protein
MDPKIIKLDHFPISKTNYTELPTITSEHYDKCNNLWVQIWHDLIFNMGEREPTTSHKLNIKIDEKKLIPHHIDPDTSNIKIEEVD